MIFKKVNSFKEKEREYQIAKLIPIIGIVTFISLYIFSSTLYPGGSQADLNSEGFDWVNNYWCNLMNEKGMNGQPNPAMPYSILATVILCLCLMFFFNQFAQAYSKSKIWKRIIKTSGIISMSFAILIFTKYHDLMTILSSLFGLFVIIGIIIELYQSELTFYKISGVVCILILGLNNYIYYSQQFIETLPLLQKITFSIVLFWIIGLNYEMNKKKKKV
tara:strand:- start:837 stop:1493 length:657 start_codon:yes stop_codon:yes gene_type:complete